MKRVTPTWLILASFLGLLLGLTPGLSRQSGDAASAAGSSKSERIDRWIAQLGDDEFDVREAATQALKGREEAAPALREALQSPDAEVRLRARNILAVLDRKRAPHELDTALALTKDGRIDEVVERLVRWQGSEGGQKGWEAVYQLATKAAETADHDFVKDGLLDLKHFPLRSSRQDLLAAQPTEIAFPLIPVTRNRNYLIRGEVIDGQVNCRRSIVAASRSVRLSRCEVVSSIVVCGGSVKVSDISYSIVICDGDFTGHGEMCFCVVIARGKVTCAPMTGCVFISTREVEFPNGQHGGCVVRTGEAHPLNFIKFFDPAEAGVEASADADGGRVPDGVLVKSAAGDKSFAAAGLRAGDVITAVGDEKIDPSGTALDQFDSFRRPLRKALAADEEFTLTVRRGDKTLELTVRPAD